MPLQCPKRSALAAWLGTWAAGMPTGEDSIASAQSVDDTTIDEIVVVGSRRQSNRVTTSPVPADVLQGELFRNIGTNDMDDVLRILIPAYNVQRLPLNDESSLVRPATLRGLPPDNTLVLIHGPACLRGTQVQT